MWWRITALPPVRALVGLIGARLVTIYLWHVPVIALLVGLTLLTPRGCPEPETPVWWWTRPAYFAATGTLALAASVGLQRMRRTVTIVPEMTVPLIRGL
ncbi:MAG: hypothetical protein H7311_06965 [Ramlibacter sp.]|nr:hypothetical protein [Cryobacterium sp.]